MTANYSSGSKMSVNVADFIALPIYVVALLVTHGMLSATPLGIDLAATMALGGGSRLSFAALVAIGCLAYVGYSNDWDNANLTWIQGWIMVTTVLLIITPPFVPIVANTLAAGPAALVAMAIQLGGFAAFSFLG